MWTAYYFTTTNPTTTITTSITIALIFVSAGTSFTDRTLQLDDYDARGADNRIDRKEEDHILAY